MNGCDKNRHDNYSPESTQKFSRQVEDERKKVLNRNALANPATYPHNIVR